jgi:hypothetical protein
MNLQFASCFEVLETTRGHYSTSSIHSPLSAIPTIAFKEDLRDCPKADIRDVERNREPTPKYAGLGTNLVLMARFSL